MPCHPIKQLCPSGSLDDYTIGLGLLHRILEPVDGGARLTQKPNFTLRLHDVNHQLPRQQTGDFGAAFFARKETPSERGAYFR